MPQEPQPGDIFALPLRHGWWGAAKLLDCSEGYTFLVIDGFWRTCPEALADFSYVKHPFGNDDSSLRSLNTFTHDEWKGWFQDDWPERFPILAHQPLTDYEESLNRPEHTYVYQSAQDFALNLHGYRIWLEDPDKYHALLASRGTSIAAKAKQRKEQLTLEKMARERPFNSWKHHWPAEVVTEAHRIFRLATKELIALQGTTQRKRRIEILRGIVDSFNALDERRHCIETSEREQVIERIEELAAFVGLKNGSAEKLTGHRFW